MRLNYSAQYPNHKIEDCWTLLCIVRTQSVKNAQPAIASTHADLTPNGHT